MSALGQSLVTKRNSLRFSNHVFATYTYSRDVDLLTAWKSVNSDFNRYVQRLRRLHVTGLHYIRTVEAHQDDYPHIHAVLQFHDTISVMDSRYFDPVLYRKWKQLWRCGISDYQPPLSTARLPILYIVKYISKGSTSKTLWRKILVSHPVGRADSTTGLTKTTNASTATLGTKFSTTLFFCKQFKIKQCTWSRGFIFPKYDSTLLVSHSLDKFN